MKFPFPVKHNGVLYPAGKNVPIGKEPKKENEMNDMSATEVKEKLKALGVTKFNSNKKSDLIAQLEEAEKAAAEKAKENEEELEDENEGNEDEESNEEEKEEGSEGQSFLDSIINE